MPDDFKPPSPRLGMCASESDLADAVEPRETKLQRGYERADCDEDGELCE